MQKKAHAELASHRTAENECQDIQTNEEMINFISLSHYEMHKLVQDTQNFHKKVKSIINQSKKQIDLGAYKQALNLLSEGEKILEYAAGSGKTIERELIVCVLHNIAACYHKLWMLQKCVRYIQGLIFNLENHLNSLQNSVMSSNNKQQILIAMQGLQMKHLLAAYYIRFCALNSQQNCHKQALASAKKSIGCIRNIFLFDQQHIRSLFRQQKEKQPIIELKHRLIVQILEFENNISIKKQKDILKAAHFSLQIWNKEKQKNGNNNYHHLKTYSIGDFMDLKPKEYHSKSQMINSVLKKGKDFEETIFYKLLLLSISFFSKSTELRLIQNEGHFYSPIDKQNCIEFIQAEIYNLLAIILISAFMPFQILYVRHLLNSYSNYFNTGLVDYKTVEQESYQKIIELISDVKFKSPVVGSTEVISSQQCLPELQSNEYKLKDRFQQKNKITRKNFHKYKKQCEKTSQNKKSNSKNFSNLQTKSVIKSQKTNSKNKMANKAQSKLKSKSKPKSKSKTLQKKSKQKDKLYFVKVTSSKPKKKSIDQQQTGNLLKKISLKKTKQGTLTKEMIGSDITVKPRKKSLLTHRISSKKVLLLAENKSPKRRNNIYGLNY